MADLETNPTTQKSGKGRNRPGRDARIAQARIEELESRVRRLESAIRPRSIDT